MINGKELSPFDLLVDYAQKAQTRQEIVDDYHEDRESYLAFRAGGQRFLLNIKGILEITIGVTDITPLPFSPKWILGLTSSRGDVFSIVDFRWFFNPEDNTKVSKSSSFIILRDEGFGYIFKVDEILESSVYDISEIQHQYSWIDGQCEINNKTYLRINLAKLATDSTFIQINQ